ncbi:MAG: hypothetical protein J6S96_04090 [Muribaculaceae bacterium]|nr:hypothetical protein [Muribaculaceae bacterium]
MNDISEILRALLDKHSNTRELDDEFQDMLRYDDQLKSDYAAWCEERGYKKSNGYREFVNEIVESQDSVWDNYLEFDS